MIETFIGVNFINIYQAICNAHDKTIYSCR